jgi:hypothetical protein
MRLYNIADVHVHRKDEAPISGAWKGEELCIEEMALSFRVETTGSTQEGSTQEAWCCWDLLVARNLSALDGSSWMLPAAAMLSLFCFSIAPLNQLYNAMF